MREHALTTVALRKRKETCQNFLNILRTNHFLSSLFVLRHHHVLYTSFFVLGSYMLKYNVLSL